MATALLQQMVKKARLLGINAVDLIATENGRPLYEKAGFRAINSNTNVLQTYLLQPRH